MPDPAVPHRSVTKAALIALAACLALAAAVLVLESSRAAHRGLTLELLGGRGQPATLHSRRVALPELPFAGQRELPRRFLRLRFAGYWQVEREGTWELRLAADGAAELRLDGETVVRRRRGATARTIRGRLALAPGPHRIEVLYEKPDPPPFLKVLRAEVGREPERLDPWDLYPAPPEPEELRRSLVVRRLRAARDIALASGLALSLAAAVRARERVLRLARSGAAPAAAVLAPLLVLYAALLRLEALVARIWEPTAPFWAIALMERAARLRPPGYPWLYEPQQYGGDPWMYLQFARAMRGFYDAHVREPVFVASARAFLELFGNENIGLNFASASFSTLLVGATYLLGRRAFSPAVGLAAAFLMAVERQVVSLSVEGWRDDAFAFFVVLSAWALLGLHDRPSFGRALGAGLVSGLACLTRLSSLSFLAPALAWIAAFGGGRPGERLKRVALCAAILAAVIAPYLLSCAVAYGDPFFAVNYHTKFYRLRAGLPGLRPMSWAEYLTYGRGPFELLDTMAVGLTRFPFSIKWNGFDDWSWQLAPLLQGAAVAGLPVMATSRRGALLVITLLASLLPYAATWPIPGGGEWRFTLHAYPFYLLAACGLLAAAVQMVDPGRRREALAARRRIALRLAAALALGLALWGVLVGLHELRTREEARAAAGAAKAGGARPSAGRPP